MSQKEDSENDIWEYKPLQKKKKRHESQPATVTKRRCPSRKSSKRDTSLSVKSPDRKVKTAENGECSTVVINIDGPNCLEAHNLPSHSSPTNHTVQTDCAAAKGPSSGDFCPMCQMPFSILVVQTQRWHVAECLDTPRDTCKECPEGLQCSSIIPNHYKKFNHMLLAHSRANRDTALLSLSQQAETSGKAGFSCLPGLINNELDSSILETSQDSALSLSVLSSQSVSPHKSHTGTPSKLTNGLLLLRSPGPEDFKKKKGWSSFTKRQKSVSASQESRAEVSSTPVKAESEQQACEGLPKSEPSLDNSDAISYSPLSEFPAETEIKISGCSKALFNNDAFENKAEDSVLLFSDGFSSEDELLTEFVNHLETNNVQVNEPDSLNTQLESVTSLSPTSQLDASTVAENRADSTAEKEARSRSTSAVSPCMSSIQSPQSIVLEHLRETLSSNSQHFKNSKNACSSQSQQPHATSSQVPSTQTPVVQRSHTMPPQKGSRKAGQASCLKQTDIGVFFGLKPLKEKEKEAECGADEVSTTSIPTFGENSGPRRQRRDRKDRQRKSKADTNADGSQGTVTDSSNVVDALGETGKGRTRRWRGRRWNRGNADGEVVLPRCPFYKKIPGTKFVIDAFQYGEIQGITAYFLTHFHSDHYGGLTKNSTLSIYCNRITGNLVKSKLKVAEQYVHILPMNTRVTVDGITVILLDANHCPGAAMLLFFLPDGQTVLHTGDFRADPSMETYPELLSCRVQTLYLDTTYCSPEYTFPRQQEAINFAASTAFELVTLNPRTLVVCGSYSVGKEKVFLALAEALGCKVCLSRDKYNTMCCLESEQVSQRITTDWKAAQVHVLPMMQLSFKKLQDHLARFAGRYDRLVAFKPTGWTFSQQVKSVDDIQPQISGNISIYGIPYSEHSSFLELKRFVQWLQPLKIIPTVNNGSWDSRKAMEKCFSEWLKETKAKL
ncbi:DNA cross-link repair 1A protein [Micropterus salmoides]|uniref:DNA cross-link repair 1A protein n=1 Tax=Micropterus salmoides TaxID=27706 RepID=UPI0018EB2F1F|nr:DNA cross-link repair 1A protein [Micropterus salmoides]